MSSTDLQNGLAQKLAQAGTPTTWVNCLSPLQARVGATASCEVTFANSDSVNALLTTTQVEEGKVDWEITQARLTEEQLTKRVSAMTGTKNVDCDSGMSGQVGSWVFCRSTRDGVTRSEVAEITKVEGLKLKLKVTPIMPSAQVQEMVGKELISVYGREPDQTVCEGDLSGVVGTAMKCRVTYDNTPESWVVTVTGVSDGVINFTLTQPVPGSGGRR